MSPLALAERPSSTDDHFDFGAWYALHWEDTRRLATRLVGDPSDGEDLAASVLADVWRRWRTAGVPDAPEAYLRRAVRNRAATLFRRRDLERAGLARLAEPAGTTVRGPEETVVARHEVDGLLARLPADERRTVEMVYLHDLGSADAARRLGIRAVSVRSRVLRSRRRLAAHQPARGA
jgi:RNA polymerase sigma factor (sigma-70 family)